MKTLHLADLKNKTSREVREHVESSYRTKLPKDVIIIIAYESVGSWGCDSSSWFLFRKGNLLFEVNGSHCSCYGFEDQWVPEKTNLKYLRSGKFNFHAGDYDDQAKANKQAIKDFISQNL